jgi:NADH:ubiquinone oxidoreductase subunit F (NADH-binding)
VSATHAPAGPLVCGDRRAGDSGLPVLGAPVTYRGQSEAPESTLAPQSLAEHLALRGPRPLLRGPTVESLLTTPLFLGLTGHGGGHFPAATKWRSMLRAGGGGVVIANGAESEPASVKDAALLQFRPHLVLDGLACAADALNARDAVIWLHDGATRTIQLVRHALHERRTAELDEVPLRIATGPRRYLTGESSAIINGLNGRPVLPTFRREPGATQGVGGRPSLVHNVETLARVALIARTASRYSETTLLTVAHCEQLTAVEVDPHTPLTAVVEATTGFSGAGLPRAVLVGGYGGVWRTWSSLVGVCASEESARAAGFSLGAGVLMPLMTADCGLARTATIADYLADSSARQCGPCLYGLRAVADALTELLDGDAGSRDLRRIGRFLDEIGGRGGCHHPDGAVRMVASALQTFADDVAEHRRRRRCAHATDGPLIHLTGGDQ